MALVAKRSSAWCTRRWSDGMEKLGLVEGVGCWRSWRAGGGPISPEGESQAWAEAETIQTGAESESGESGGDLQGVRCRGGRGAQEGALDLGALPLLRRGVACRGCMYRSLSV